MKQETEILKDIEAMLAPYAVSNKDAFDLCESTSILPEHRMSVVCYKSLIQELVTTAQKYGGHQSIRDRLAHILSAHKIVPDHPHTRKIDRSVRFNASA